MTEKMIVAVDPGREKCGVAVVRRDEGAVCKKVVETRLLKETIEKLVGEYAIEAVVLGDGTSSKNARALLSGLQKNAAPLPVRLVDEYKSTEEAKLLYFRDHPPKGLLRFLPISMQVPPVPVDDYVALILGKRYFQQ